MKKSAWTFSRGWARVPALERRLGMVLAATGRALGDMKDPSAFARALRRAGLDPARWAGGQQVHGRRVRWVARPSENPRGSPGTDGVAADARGPALRVFAADCVPIYLVDEKRGALALVHAGWRGTVKGILGNAVEMLRKRGVMPRDLWAAFGPHIHPCCYEVGEEVARHFRKVPGAARPRPGAPGKSSLDLSRALARQAQRAGIRPGRILSASFCTCCDRRFFSFRRDKTEKRMAALAAFFNSPRRP
jgi:YfiH family protein